MAKKRYVAILENSPGCVLDRQEFEADEKDEDQISDRASASMDAWLFRIGDTIKIREVGKEQ